MAAGDIAGLAGYTVQPDSRLANLLGEFIRLVQDDLASKTGDKGAPIPLTLGGTGGATAAEARVALELVKATSLADTVGKIAAYSDTGQIGVNTPTSTAHATNKQYVDGLVAGIDTSNKVSKSGDTMTGDLTITGSGNHLFVPDSTLASSGYTTAYINGDGRLSRGASSRRYKKNIKNAPRDAFGQVLELRPVTFQWRDTFEKSEHIETGLIAEEVAEMVPWLVVHDADGRPDSVLYERLGLALLPIVQAQVETIAQLAARVTALEDQS